MILAWRIAVAGVLGMMAAGCAAGVLAYKFSPPPTIPAQYTPAKEPTVVLVENYQNPDSLALESERLGRVISDEMNEHKVAPMVHPNQLFELRSEKPAAFAKMDIPALGRTVGARQVVYVNLVRFDVDTAIGSQLVKGKAVAIVRLVNSEDGRVLWPRDSQVGRQIRFETPYLPSAEPADQVAMEERMYRALGDQISKLFYAWQSEQVNGNEPE